ncbi:hypothetical protein HYU21_01750 [Candidatus Woesearchaeota archaeon]|nr:hypothetical protein [Candidatus Woesearchaeota archaeon]
MKQIILPSLMCHSQEELEQDLRRLKGTAKVLHLDIVNGKFANNETFQFDFKLVGDFKYQAHLMINNPEKWIREHFSEIDLFIPHIEKIKDVKKHIKELQIKDKKIAFALLPETNISSIEKFLLQTDCILVLTVQPGFYGSKFLPEQLEKISKIKEINPRVKVIVDGGMNPKTIKLAAKAGADLFVSGSYTTKAEIPKERVELLEKSVGGVK